MLTTFTWSGTETQATGEVLLVNVHGYVKMDSNAHTWSGMEMQAIGEVDLYDLLLPCITSQYHSYSNDPIFVAGKEEKLL